MRMVSQRKVAPLLDIDDLLARFRNREASVGVIGLGYVGLPLSLAACAAGFRVRGFDINQERVEGLNCGRGPPGRREGGENGPESRARARAGARGLPPVTAPGCVLH